MPNLPFSKPCEAEDFAHPELAPLLRLTEGSRVARWEAAMAIRALRRFGAVHPDAAIVAIVPAADQVVRQLASEVTRVQLCNDLPDARRLDSDTRVDAVYCTRTLEHVGDLHDAARAMSVAGALVKQGGVLVVSTRLRVAGPPGGIGWPRTHAVFSPAHLQRFVVAPSGLRLVDGLQVSLSEATLTSPRRIQFRLPAYDAAVGATDDDLNQDMYAEGEGDHLLEVEDGYVSTAVHLTLVRTHAAPDAGPLVTLPGPTPRVGPRRSGLPPPLARALPPATGDPSTVLEERRALLAERVDAMDRAHAEATRRLRELQRRLHDFDLRLARLAEAKGAVDSRLSPAGERP